MSVTPDEQQRFNSMYAKLANVPNASLQLGPIDGFVIVSYLQIALRHPQAGGSMAKRVKQIGRIIQDALASQVPEAGEFLEKGWSPEYHVFWMEPENETIACYSHLPKEYQVEIVANSIALQIACLLISEMNGKPREDIFSIVCSKAAEVIDQMDESDISHVIMTMDLSHQVIDETDEDDDNN
jgi:hypothetical protein